jgi:DnaJ-class molecular chaperone
MNYDNYYNILNLSKNATINDIKKAYRQLSIRFHPDKNKNCDPEQFNKINEAYSKLLDKYNSNSTYNVAELHNEVEKYHKNESHNDILKYCNSNFNSNMNSNMNSNFNSNINSNINSNNAEDITTNLNISFNEAYNGCNKPIVVNRKITVNNVIGNEIETLYIPIPKGIDNNEIITLPNKGNVYISNGIINYSNIKVIISLLKHEVFERNGLDIIFVKTITLKQALLGFTFNLNHINNKNFKITCFEIINFNYEKVIPNMGFIRDTFVGNLIIKFNITFPLTISQESKQVLEKVL